MKPMFSWRQAILISDLHSTTKLVLLTLSCHMSDMGESCFPSTKTLESETSLSERTVITHLHIAKELGWLKIGLHGFGGQKWKSHEYTISIPEKALKEVQQLNGKGTEPDAEGTEPDDQKALKEVQSNSTSNSPMNSPNIYNGDKPKKPRFIKPRLLEVQAYCRERNNRVDPESFIDHYEANGWHVGKNPMKDWRAAVRTWEKSSRNKPQQTNNFAGCI